MINWLKSEWHLLTKNYCNSTLAESLWAEIESQYIIKNRHYHNLSHIFNMLKQLDETQTKIKDLDSLKFAIWYHDIIYKSTNKNNEEKSALFALNRLKKIDFNLKRAQNVQELILSTKKHTIIKTQNNDNAVLLDLDLSILGTDWNTYKKYISNIRKEYKIYPNFMYNPGRKKMLNHFLERETLYFTEHNKEQYEAQARENLNREIKLL
ncbi:HD domain-containing protein [Olleya namhaensis]|uniref:HD domain-containing protein n=1 Tax=Olleya namhaensis TaxID=1144750 RepID=UPI0024919013|nr:hypothetical protein [Olleya namhaensis]